MTPKSEYIMANGINHHYLDWGNSSGRPLLMLHATGLCAAPWAPIARELAKDFHVMAFDQRGHGDSDPSDGGYNFHQVGQDLAELIQVLDFVRRVHSGTFSGRVGGHHRRFVAAGPHPSGRVGRDPGGQPAGWDALW